LKEPRAVAGANVAPMRSERDGRSEQISQVILGETLSILEQADDDFRVTTPDGYSGWVRGAHLAILETGELYPDPHRAAMIAPLYQPVFREPSGRSERLTMLTIGTTVEMGESDPGVPYFPIRLPRGGTGFVESSSLIVPEYPVIDHIGPNLLVIGRGMVGVPYLWGGRTPFGFDCSGFVQRLFWLCGRIVPRDAYEQAASPLFSEVRRENLRPGDLVFFRGERNPLGRSVTHVGVATGDGRFLHASAALGVAFTPLDTAPYTREFVCARRFRG
jgi:gamma-D-glutamyl-L-lysine dipeptidyl-peptidase